MSEREHQEVSEYERQYQDSSDPRVLDVIDIPLVSPVPKLYQQENWLLEPTEYWVKRGRVGWDDLAAFADPQEPLWLNGYSTYNGLNDKLPETGAALLKSSLRLIYVDRLTLSVLRPGLAFGNPKRRLQGRFNYTGVSYAIWVTDPVYELAYLAKEDGDYSLGGAYLTMSIGEAFEGHCYKLIAAIFEKGAATS